MTTSIVGGIKPCVKCGAKDRLKNGNCRPCSAKYRAANAEKTKAYMLAYYANNRERLKASSARRLEENRSQINKTERERYVKESHWRERNPDRHRAWRAEYLAANLELRRIYEHNRRAKKKELGGSLSRGLSAKLFKLQKGKCPCCALPLGDDYHMDHKMPMALGGANADDNMQLLRKGCNLEKQAKHPVDFMQSRGFLL